MGECGFFGGSFDPFTVAHKSVVDRALPLFSRLVIGIGVNTAKRPWQPVEERPSGASTPESRRSRWSHTTA